jgi:membrane protease YdiL (CAAX protease family)
MPLSFTAVLQIPLWVGLLGVPIWATRTKGNGPVRDLGLRARWVDLPIGAAIGVAAQFALVPLVYWPIFQLFGEQDVSAAARQLTDRATDPFAIVMLFLIVGVGAPFAEEVFFRGLTQRSLDRRFGSVVALVGTAVFFALTHFEPLQFPALVAFALILGMAATRTGRLGMSIAAHVTFNVSAVIVSVWAFDLTPLMVVVSGLLGVVAVTALVLMTRVGTAGAPGDPSALPSDDTMNGTWPTP